MQCTHRRGGRVRLWQACGQAQAACYTCIPAVASAIRSGLAARALALRTAPLRSGFEVHACWRCTAALLRYECVQVMPPASSIPLPMIAVASHLPRLRGYTLLAHIVGAAITAISWTQNTSVRTFEFEKFSFARGNKHVVARELKSRLSDHDPVGGIAHRLPGRPAASIAGQPPVAGTRSARRIPGSPTPDR